MTEIVYDLYECSADRVSDWYVKRNSKSIWGVFNSRKILDGVLIQPRQNFLYYEFDKVSPLPSRRGNPRRVIKKCAIGNWLVDFQHKTAFEALLRTFWSNPGDYMHIRIYCVFSPYCVTNDVEKLLVYLNEQKTITMDIYFANIHGFNINKPEEWLTKDNVPDGIKLRRLAKHKNIKDFRIFGRDEWEFIAAKLGEEFSYRPKAVEDVWDKVTYGDEEYADVWKAVMENKLGELRHRIWPQFLPSTLKVKECSSCHHYSSVEKQHEPVVEEDEYFPQYFSSEPGFLFGHEYYQFYLEQFPSQNGVDKRTRPIRRNEWKNITREATILANLQ